MYKYLAASSGSAENRSELHSERRTIVNGRESFFEEAAIT
jgi:hypothetical protein